jgi:hypothetical protein
MLLMVLHVSCENGCETVRLVACSCGSCNREDRGVGVGRGSCSCGTVGFMADSGMFVMVCGHGISAFPNTILIMTEFSSGEESS